MIGEARAHARWNFACQRVDILLGEQRPDGRMAIMQPVNPTFTEVPVGTAPEDGPSLTLPEPMARALLDALAEHFGGTSSVRALQRDLAKERERVDRLIEHIAAIAKAERP